MVLWCNCLITRGFFLVKNQLRLMSPWRIKYKWLSSKAASCMMNCFFSDKVLGMGRKGNVIVASFEDWMVYYSADSDLIIHTDTHFEPQSDEGQVIFLFFRTHVPLPLHKSPICIRLLRHSHVACRIPSFYICEIYLKWKMQTFNFTTKCIMCILIIVICILTTRYRYIKVKLSSQ